MTDGSPQPHGDLRTLSSAATEPSKVVGVVLASLFTLVTVALFLLRREVLPALLLLGLSIVLWLRAWVGLRLSVVETDGERLLVSSPSRTASIPLTEVMSVTRFWFPGAQRIYVEVGPDTPFGREIVFEARFELAAIVGRHPVVEELRALVAQARAFEARAGARSP